jgi:hypothetical protein
MRASFLPIAFCAALLIAPVTAQITLPAGFSVISTTAASNPVTIGIVP